MSAPDFAMVDVFCHDGGGGNPTGLVLEADALSAADMQNLAKQCGHESGFVLRPGDPDTADFRFRYFVPRHEMEMCGHATVGALWLMREQGRIDAGTYRIETESGLVTGHVGAQVEITAGLRTGEQIVVDGPAALTDGVHYDITQAGGIKTALFGGEGLFLAKLEGPGKVWLQSLPFSRLAGRMLAAAPQRGGTQKGEGSVLGSFGNLLDGDN